MKTILLEMFCYKIISGLYIKSVQFLKKVDVRKISKCNTDKVIESQQDYLL